MRTEEGGGEWIRHLRLFPHGDVHPPEACVGCGTPTDHRAVLAVTPALGIVSDKVIRAEGCPWCPACEAKRNRRQLERIAANEAVLPHLREDARQQLAVVTAA